MRLALAGRDRDAAAMAQTRELVIPGPGGALAARLYRPAGSTACAPALLFFHGGGFVVCDIETHDALCRRLAAAGRVTVISIAYRLAPEAPFPAQIEDGEAAARWVIGQAGPLEIDAARLALGGDSAGAYIAAAVTARLNAERKDAVAGQLLIYPLLNLDDEVWASSVAAESRILGRLAVAYIRAQLQTIGMDAPSLLEPDPALAPRTVVVSGGRLDPCRPDARRYAETLAGGGGEVVVREYLALPHGFANFTHASAAAREAVAEIGALLGHSLRR